MDHTVIYRNCTDHNRTFTCQFAAEWLRISVAGQIHDRLCAKIYRTHDLFHLNVIVFTVSGNAKIDINLCTEHTSYPFRIQTGMILVCTDRYLSFSNQFL